MELYRRDLKVTLATGSHCRLHVENPNGYVRVRRQEAPEVSIVVSFAAYAASGEEADAEVARLREGINQQGVDVRIRTPHMMNLRPPSGLFGLRFPGGGPRVNYEIAVPQASEVSVEARNGAVNVRGIAGPVAVESHNGAVEVADVGGVVRVQARNGAIRVREAKAAVEVRNTNGPVTVEDAGGPVRAETTNGWLALRDFARGGEARSTNGAVTYHGPVAGNLHLETTNGGISVHVPRSSRFELDAESHNGRVTSDLPVRGTPGESDADSGVRVRLRSNHGSIRISTL